MTVGINAPLPLPGPETSCSVSVLLPNLFPFSYRAALNLVIVTPSVRPTGKYVNGLKTKETFV